MNFLRFALIKKWLYPRLKEFCLSRPSLKRKRRRGATAMEYLVVISLILVVMIITIQQLGVATGGLFKTSANATNTASSSGS